jgi:hypothetical protein
VTCPKCGFDSGSGAVECARCGVIFARLNREPTSRIVFAPTSAEIDAVTDGRIGPAELKILGFGLAAAIVAYAVPFTRFVFSTLVTLFHELGHAVMGWLLGYPSLPAFDFVYGGGMTHHGAFRFSIALAVAGVFAWLAWTFRENKTSLALIGALFLLWFFFVTREWRREVAFAAAGHLAEFILAGILFYKALAGVGWRVPEIERPLGAFVAFFVQIHATLFAWRLLRDPAFLSWYRGGKGGALMNDLEVIALDLQIWLGIAPGIEGVAKALLAVSLLPITLSLIWYFERARCHRVLRALRTAQS